MESVDGYLEKLEKGFGFLRQIEENFNPSPGDTFVPGHMINRLRLDDGVFIQGKGDPGDPGKPNLKLSEIEYINHRSVEEYMGAEPLQNQISIHPTEQFTLTQEPDDLMGMALDMVTPVGRGQRGLVVSPPKAGKTTVLKHMGGSLVMNHPDTKVFVLLVDERPEEVTDFKRGLKGVNVLSSSSDQSIVQHIRITGLAMNTAVRWAETGCDAVVFIDSLTRMARAFNAETDSYGRTLSGGLGANTMAIPRRIFGAARNVENGGSLTIIASILVDTGSRMDEIIFQEFKGTGNMDLVLSRKCAEKRIWPAVNINKSGTRNEELLMKKAEYLEVVKLRRSLSTLDETAAMEMLLDYLSEKG